MLQKESNTETGGSGGGDARVVDAEAEATRVLKNEFRYMEMGHRQLAQQIPIPAGYTGPLDQEAIHKFTMEHGQPAMTMRDVADKVKELDAAGHQRVKMPTGVTEDEVAILKVWIRMRDPAEDRMYYSYSSLCFSFLLLTDDM